MSIIYNKCWCCLRSYYIIRNILSYIYPLLRPLNSFVGGGGQHYVILMACPVKARRDWIIRSVRRLLPALIYPQRYTMLPMVHLMQVPRGSIDNVTIADVLT